VKIKKIERSGTFRLSLISKFEKALQDRITAQAAPVPSPFFLRVQTLNPRPPLAATKEITYQ
jgi:hypothetical protein